MTFVGVEVKPKQLVWIDASSERQVILSNACLVKPPIKSNARVVLQICKPEDNQESNRVAIAVLSSNTENVRLDLPITSRLALSIAGENAKGAVIHIVGNEIEVEDYDYEEENGNLQLTSAMGMQVIFDTDDDGDDDDDDDDDDDEIMSSHPPQHKNDKVADKSRKAAAADANKKVAVRKSQLPIITHRSGLKFQDVIVGCGKPAVRGRNIATKYTLRLENGKVIDKSDARRPFKFRLGIGECVKGFDIGITGMREGGERHLIVPPDLAYGDRPPPGIPRNATLYFDVNLIKAF